VTNFWKLSSSLLLAVACAAPPPPAPLPPERHGHLGDAAPDSPCARGCQTLRRIGCEEGEPLHGVSCADLCTDIQQRAEFDLKPECIARAATLADARACGVRCPNQP
jgi:hypothetical protein